MKKYLSGIATVAMLMASQVVSALPSAAVELSPMVLIELQASMKADLVLAPRLMALDIKDDLQAQSEVMVSESQLDGVRVVLKRIPVEQLDWMTGSED